MLFVSKDLQLIVLKDRGLLNIKKANLNDNCEKFSSAGLQVHSISTVTI